MKHIIIHECGLRDGLQMEKQVVPTDKKLQWARALDAAGVDIVQVGSFVHPEKVPQMADTDALIRTLTADANRKTTYSGLVLNEKGLERGLACGVDMFCFGASASETHSRKNTGMGSEEALHRIIAIAKQAMDLGKKVQVSVQCAFGCGFEGQVPEERVMVMAKAFIDAGLTSVSFADTAGHAHPEQVRRMFGKLCDMAPNIQATCHFHDTYGLGMANIHAALEAGVTMFECSFAGLGGCPFTKVAAGNVATEDVVHSLRRRGMCKHVDLGATIALARDVVNQIGRELPGRVYKTGPLSN
jgi:hydroxymethylglutaryl-CoA lyase